ncbi:MAG: rod shape-determining protein MreC [Verrucomicrobia bacterium]|nr:rod shape-determining protein MreC [Verrucomicrobiota bacterium]
MSKRPHYWALAGVALVALSLLNLPEATATKAKLVVSSLFLPLFGLVGSGQNLWEQGTVTLSSRRALQEQIEGLRSENRQLRAAALQGAEALRENERLRRLLGWQQQSSWHLRAGRVIARDTANWWRTVRIDLGSRDGVRVDLPVLDQDGLLGRVLEVGLTSAQVVLLGDPQCRVAVVVRETGESGVITAIASGVLDHRLVDLTHLPRNSALRPGQTVYTSGLGGLFPAGIPVGSVVDARSVGYGLYTEARVKLAADSSRMREVMVLFPGGPELGRGGVGVGAAGPGQGVGR